MKFQGHSRSVSFDKLTPFEDDAGTKTSEQGDHVIPSISSQGDNLYGDALFTEGEDGEESEYSDLDDQFKSDVSSTGYDQIPEQSVESAAELVAATMRQIAKIEARKRWIENEAKEEIEAIERQRDSMLKDETRKLEYIHYTVGGVMEDYLKRYIDGKNIKTFKTLYGNLTLRKISAALKVESAEDVLKWAKEHLPEAVVTKTTESVVHKTLKEHFEAVGEIPDGCVFTPSYEKFEIKPTLTKE